MHVDYSDTKQIDIDHIQSDMPTKIGPMSVQKFAVELFIALACVLFRESSSYLFCVWEYRSLGNRNSETS